MPLDARTDLFSFGVVLYEMATGLPPFRGDSPGLIFDAILNRPPVPPAHLNPGVPAEWERIIDKCLEKDRDLRYQSASDIRADLQRLKRDTDSGRVAPTSRSEAIDASPKRGKAAMVAQWRPCWRSSVRVIFTGGVRRSSRTRTPSSSPTSRTRPAIRCLTERFVKAWRYSSEQSPFLSLISEERIQGALRLMGQPPDARLTPELARGLLRANRQRRRARWLDCQPRKPVCPGPSGQGLPHRRRAG